MSLEKHSLLKDFPEHHHTIRHLKMNDAHFVRLLDEYSEIDNNVYHFESGEKACSDEYLEQQKRRRVELKDELFQMLKAKEDTI